MELKGIAGGDRFSINKLKDKLGYENYHLKDARDSILKIVRGSQSAIRGGNFKSAKAMSKFKSDNKGMTSDEIHRVKKVFDQLGSVPAPKEESIRKAVEGAAVKKSTKTAELTARTAGLGKMRPSMVQINRDPGSYTNIDTYRLEKHGTGLASGSISSGGHYGVAANRGETSDKSLETRDVNKSAGYHRVNI